MKTTVREFLDNVEKNGYPWGKGAFYNPIEGTSCAVGQAIRNYGFEPDETYTIVNESRFGPQEKEIDFESIGWLFADTMYNAIRKIDRDRHIPSIISLNDSPYHSSLQSVVDEIRKDFPEEFLNLEFEVPVNP